MPRLFPVGRDCQRDSQTEGEASIDSKVVRAALRFPFATQWAVYARTLH